MRYASELACAALCIAAASARAQAPAPSNSCPISSNAAALSYDRLHQIPTVADRNDVSHRIVTPGGMVLDTPKMVAATDVLTIIARDAETLCFSLLTFARDRHRCELSGVALKSNDSYVFRDDAAVVRFTFIGDDQVSVEPVGTGHRTRCERFGKIDSATYTRPSLR